jgi:hypothetical protein
MRAKAHNPSRPPPDAGPYFAQLFQGIDVDKRRLDLASRERGVAASPAHHRPVVHYGHKAPGHRFDWSANFGRDLSYAGVDVARDTVPQDVPAADSRDGSPDADPAFGGVELKQV